MADTGQHAGRTTPSIRDHGPARRTGWFYWLLFAGIMMMIAGSFHAIEGLVALFHDTYYVVRPSGLVVSLDYTAWGWAHLLLGLAIFAAGCGVLVGQLWARVIGVIIAAVSAVANMLFIAAYPLWSIILIAVDIVIIYALCVHGREAQDI